MVQSLARDVPRVGRRAVERRILAGAAVGAAVSALLAVAVLGLRDDLGTAARGAALWTKVAYTLSLALAAVAMSMRLARPGRAPGRVAWVTAVPVLLLGALGAVELTRTPPADRMALWLGESWASCPWLVLALAVPVFAGLLRAYRRLAPTRLRAAGAAAGLTAGALAATVYCLHCPEASALFVLTWYSLGIVLAALAGALLGPLLLRW
ncbi:DUF1109 domain-containing protein [Acuticoccus sp. I52.16.1]|uniref:DUF1109 domain-containing protein n=1 Tax=Acuticoccus sp. I52.16.1 TaxID=2928472 RepID=UPI001FD2F14D|nr:DUF1109 domain-containing protein [Acuticoccus sp. I52.16.1]UOM35666.1 DUF1109 domain-containing protein [Acuticoccus sp. I52.16.1]